MDARKVGERAAKSLLAIALGAAVALLLAGLYWVLILPGTWVFGVLVFLIIAGAIYGFSSVGD